MTPDTDFVIYLDRPEAQMILDALEILQPDPADYDAHDLQDRLIQALRGILGPQ